MALYTIHDSYGETFYGVFEGPKGLDIDKIREQFYDKLYPQFNYPEYKGPMKRNPDYQGKKRRNSSGL